MAVRRREGGQASVELVALLPLAALVALAIGQLLAAGSARELAGNAAEAGAAALLQGTDPTAAARAALRGGRGSARRCTWRGGGSRFTCARGPSSRCSPNGWRRPRPPMPVRHEPAARVPRGAAVPRGGRRRRGAGGDGRRPRAAGRRAGRRKRGVGGHGRPRAADPGGDGRRPRQASAAASACARVVRRGGGDRRAGAGARPAGGRQRASGWPSGGARRPSSSACRRLFSRPPCARRRAPAAARLAASMRARHLEASARGRLAFVHLPDRGRTDAVTAPSRPRTGCRPSSRSPAATRRSTLLATRDAILVALPSSAEPALAQLALAGACRAGPAAAAVTLALDPVQRALALAGRARRARSAPPCRSWRPASEERRRCSRACADSWRLRGSACHKARRDAAGMAAWRREDGQASVETAALLPLVVLVGALLWQAVVAGPGAVGCRARPPARAARAAAVGADAEEAARATLPPRLESGLRVRQVGGRGRCRGPRPVGPERRRRSRPSTRARVFPRQRR
jgi:pilus assembly protein CpaE